MLVEDDDGDALIVEEELALADRGHEIGIHRVRRLSEALEVLAEAAPACVLLDLGLPDSNGLAAVARLREVTDAPIVVLTGTDDEQQGVAAMAQGAQDYLVKGRVDGQLLVRAMRYAAERQRAEAAAVALREAQMVAGENARLERSLLPTPVVHRTDLALATAYRPGRRTGVLGGDFLDAVETPDGTLHVVIGDVSGHSADEAALGASLRIAWRVLVLNGADPDTVFPSLDQVIALERHAPDVFATALMLSVDQARTEVTLRIAGHPCPVLLRPDAATETLDGRRQVPLGLQLVDAWPVTTFALPPSGALVLHTDGLTETPVGDVGDRLGEQGLIALLDGPLTQAETAQDAAAALEGVVATVEQRAAGPITDDVALLWLGWG